MASRALAVHDPNAAWPGCFVAACLAHVGPLIGRALHSNRVTPWSASMQDETLTVDMTRSAVRRLALGVSARLQGLARLFEQLETGYYLGRGRMTATWGMYALTLPG
jgi:hypothetical protein